jgi:cyanophycinase
MPTTSKFLGGHRRGRLLIIGGAEDPDESDMRILPHLVKRAGGKKARILVNAAPTTHAAGTLREYRKAFQKIGVAEVLTLPMDTRTEANSEQALGALEKATCVFFTGGDQLRLTSAMSGSDFGQRLRERFNEGLFVAGTSAGAAAIAGTMIIGGRGSIVCRECVDLAPGLGFWDETVIDTHFNREGRVHRLMAAIAMNPGVLGIGVDEDTAIEVSPSGKATVIGRGNVMIFDGRVEHTNVANVEETEPLAMIGSTLHVLCAGYGLDLHAMEPTLPKPEVEMMRDRP